MRYLSNAAIRAEIREGMQSQEIDERELAERLETTEDAVNTFLSDGYEFSVWEINAILNALDLSLRFEVVPA